MILIDSQEYTESTILGELSQEFVTNNAILKQVIIKPATESTTFDFSLVDKNGNVTYEETNCSGTFNELVEIPLYGNTLLNISNSSRDELYKLIFNLRRS
jgi:hypothetical protein